MRTIISIVIVVIVLIPIIYSFLYFRKQKQICKSYKLDKERMINIIKKLVIVVIIAIPFLAYSEDQTFITLSDIALQGQLQKTGFYLNSKNCSTTTKSNLHVAYYQKDDVLIFGYFDAGTGMIKNYIWDRKKGETSILSCRFDEVADPKKAIKISEHEMKDSSIRFRADWLICK